MAIDIKTSKQVVPKCYAYTLPGVPEKAGQTKIGFTERDVDTRIKEQLGASHLQYTKEWSMLAMYITDPIGPFTDKPFHAHLQKKGVLRIKGSEWFKIDPALAKAEFINFAMHQDDNEEAPSVIPYTLREEQAEAVNKAWAYFDAHPNSEFLWNAKPRFGKTLAAYDLCKKIDAINVLIVTNRPAIANSWYDDYMTFIGPESGLLFVSNVDAIKSRPYVYSRQAYTDRLHDFNGPEVKGCIEFVSLQDLKGSDMFGGRFEKLHECAEIDWDILIIDEAHEGVDTYKTDLAFDHIKRKRTLHLSGTPFKAIASEKFSSDAIYNWTYADEQKRKRDWDNSNEAENPYANLPVLNLYTYQMSDIVRDKVKSGIQLADEDVAEYAFDLNEFFAVDKLGRFKHDDDVNKFLDALANGEKFPFSTPELRNELRHTLWILKYVESARALAKKLQDHPVFKDYHVVLAAGDGKIDDDDENAKAFDKVQDAIKEYPMTITISVGQLTVGITIPEWTAVLMLSNIKSPSLYMQAAFRAQNPCLFKINSETWRKQNAYVFDFDPARTLDIYEQFANNLIPETAGEKGTSDEKKAHVRELLNFFPVYGEDDAGRMVMLDAESVLTIPRHIHAKEVVERGFMSNFLFSIKGVFGMSNEIIEIVNKLQPSTEPKKLADVPLDETSADQYHINEDGEVEIPEEQIIGLQADMFGEKIYESIEDELDAAVDAAREELAKDPKKDELTELQEKFGKPMADKLMDAAKKTCGDEMSKSTQRHLTRRTLDKANQVVRTEFGEYTIKKNQLENECDHEIQKAQDANISMTEITAIRDEFEQRIQQAHDEMITNIRENMGHDFISEAGKDIAEAIETEKTNKAIEEVYDGFKDHLRGFSRTIPIFLMAYGTRETRLGNFDSLPDNVFLEVTGITVDEFRQLRDEGQLFDVVVFDDAIQEFISLKERLADYFDPAVEKDIFSYVPPQKTNQIFTPKKVVADMVDRLEKENPGCFDSDTATFADLYMKSGMYITEIVKRLYNSPRLQTLYPDKAARLNHIFATQVYGLAPTEIIYNVCLSYILGFSDEIEIAKHNIKFCDALAYAKEGTLEDKLTEMFPELGEGKS